MTWDEWDYQLGLCYRLWRAMPTPPSKKKQPELWATYEKVAEGWRQRARELHALQPKTTRTAPWPKDPEDALKDPSK